MKVFKVPFDTKREEKIFGGYLSLRQVLYLMLSTTGLILFITQLPIALKILFVVLFSSFFLLCAFFKINEQNFDKFFFYAVKYLCRKKRYVYERCCK